MADKQQFSFTVITIIYLFCSALRATDISTNTHEDLEKIKKYELVHFDLSSFKSSNIISFDAFGLYYKVQLRLNEDLNPLYLKHTNGPLSHKYNLTQFWSNLTSSCHYFATVINTDSISSGSISLCDKRGIRGVIHAFGDSIRIKPAKYYLDVRYDASNYHNLHDKHLVFKRSDHENMHKSSDSLHAHHHNRKSSPPQSAPQAPNGRRLLASSNLVETASFVAPDLVSSYKSKYSSNWEDQILSDLSDLWNYVSDVYKNAKICSSEGRSCSTGWGSSVGSIRVKWIEVNLLESWVMGEVQKRYVQSARESLYDGSPLLDNWMDYLQRKHTNADYDVVTLFMANGMAGEAWDTQKQEVDWIAASGVAPLGTMCDKSYPSPNIVCGIGTWFQITAAHELGHNIGLEHDGQGENSCSDDDGIMGYGDAKDFWSTCTRDYMQKFFRRENPDCLNDEHESKVGQGSNTGNDRNTGNDPDQDPYGSYDPYSYDPNQDTNQDRNQDPNQDTNQDPYSYDPNQDTNQDPNQDPYGSYDPNQDPNQDTNVDPYGSYDPNEEPNKDPNERPSSGGGCVTISNMRGFSYDGSRIDFNGDWNKGGSYNGESVYTFSTFYLYRSSYDYWVIGAQSGSENDDDIWAWCKRTSLSSCGSGYWEMWVYHDDEWDEVRSSMSVSTSCSGSYAAASSDYSSCDTFLLQCVSIESIVDDANGYNYGEYKWKPAGCKDGYAYYTTSAWRNRYLCYDETRRTYVISNKLCDGGDIFAYGGPPSIDILKYAHWKVMSEDGEYIKDQEVYTSECSMDGFTYHSRKFTSCLSEGYDTCVKVYNNGFGDLLWNGSVEFNAFEQFCVNDKPIYSHVEVVDDTYDGRQSPDEDGEFVFYLRYSEENTWVISVNNRIYDSHIHAICDQFELSECVNDTWKVMRNSVDTRWFEANPSMTIEVGTCTEALTTQEANGIITNMLWMVAIIAIVALVPVLIVVLWVKRQRSNMINNQKMMEVVEDESEVEVEYDEETITMSN